MKLKLRVGGWEHEAVLLPSVSLRPMAKDIATGLERRLFTVVIARKAERADPLQSLPGGRGGRWKPNPHYR